MADSSLEYASLLPVQGEIMPDDELDGVGGHPSLTSNLDDNDELLTMCGVLNPHILGRH